MDNESLNLSSGIYPVAVYRISGTQSQRRDCKNAGKETQRQTVIQCPKKENRKISEIRITVEHAIADIKRRRKFEFNDSVMLIACGLHNFRVEFEICITLLNRMSN
jgi:hypothetical protein